MLEYTSERMPNRKTQYMPDRMPDRMSDEMSDRIMSQYM